MRARAPLVVLAVLAVLVTCSDDTSETCVIGKNPNCLGCKPDRDCPSDTCWDCVAEPGTDNAIWECVDTSTDSCQYGD
jgi:hypothetical protein